MSDLILDKIKPLPGRFYVKVDDRTKNMGSIIIPDKYSQLSETGTIVKLTPDKETEEMGLKEGQKILFTFYAGIHIQLPETYTDSHLHRILAPNEVLAIIEE